MQHARTINLRVSVCMKTLLQQQQQQQHGNATKGFKLHFYGYDKMEFSQKHASHHTRTYYGQ